MHRTGLIRASALVITVLLAGNLSVQAQTRLEGTAQAQPKAAGDPPKILYRVSGVTDQNTGSNSGVATAFQCTNLSTVTETLSFQVRTFDGTLKASKNRNVSPQNTIGASTHLTNLFFDDVLLSTGSLNQGSALIRSSSINVVCTAMIVDAAAVNPIGIALHMVRFNPMAGSQE